MSKNRPVLHLSYISKVMEGTVAIRLNDYLADLTPMIFCLVFSPPTLLEEALYQDSDVAGLVIILTAAAQRHATLLGLIESRMTFCYKDSSGSASQELFLSGFAVFFRVIRNRSSMASRFSSCYSAFHKVPCWAGCCTSCTQPS